MTRNWAMVVGLGMVLGGCWKHETSSPHLSVELTVEGENAGEIPAARFEDGWSVKLDRFWLAAAFGIDDVYDPAKVDGPRVTGAEAYVYGSGGLDLTQTGPQPVYGGWILAGHSTGWGMSLRQGLGSPSAPEEMTSVEVAGVATGPDGERLELSWRFDQTMTFAHCLKAGESSLVLPEGEVTMQLPVQLDAASLFRPIGASELAFGRLAEADADADGVITTDELRALPLSDDERRLQSRSAQNWYELLGLRLKGLVPPGFSCQVSPDACRDAPLEAACEGSGE